MYYFIMNIKYKYFILLFVCILSAFSVSAIIYAQNSFAPDMVQTKDAASPQKNKDLEPRLEELRLLKEQLLLQKTDIEKQQNTTHEMGETIDQLRSRMNDFARKIEEYVSLTDLMGLKKKGPSEDASSVSSVIVASRAEP